MKVYQIRIPDLDSQGFEDGTFYQWFGTKQEANRALRDWKVSNRENADMASDKPELHVIPTDKKVLCGG